MLCHLPLPAEYIGRQTVIFIHSSKPERWVTSAGTAFSPSKNLGAFGDGGLTTTRDPALVPLLKAIRMHGMETQYFHRFVGGNFRLDALQAAVLSVKLAHLPAWSAARRGARRRLPGAFRRGPVCPTLCACPPNRTPAAA